MKRIFMTFVLFFIIISMLSPTMVVFAQITAFSAENSLSYTKQSIAYTVSNQKYYLATLKRDYNGVKEGTEFYVDSYGNVVTDALLLDKLKTVNLYNKYALQVIENCKDMIVSSYNDEIATTYVECCRKWINNGQAANYLGSAGVNALKIMLDIANKNYDDVLDEAFDFLTDSLDSVASAELALISSGVIKAAAYANKFNYYAPIVSNYPPHMYDYDQLENFFLDYATAWASLKLTEMLLNATIDDILSNGTGFWAGLKVTFKNLTEGVIGVAFSEFNDAILYLDDDSYLLFDDIIADFYEIGQVNLHQNALSLYEKEYNFLTNRYFYDIVNVSSEDMDIHKKLSQNDTQISSYFVGTYKVTTKDGLNIRSGANTAGTRLTAMPYGTQFIVTKISGSWGYTTYAGKSGWTYLGGNYTSYVSTSTVPQYTSLGSEAVVKRINKLITLLNGKYFTTTQKSCGNNKCDKCFNTNIINTTWFKSIFGNINSVYQFPSYWAADSGRITSPAWTCAGFANFAQWYIFKTKNTDYITDKLIVQNASWNYNNVSKYCKAGDIIRLGTATNKDQHSAIFISCDSTGVNVLDNNYNGDSKISTRKYYYSYWTNFTVSRATNYDVITDAEATPSDTDPSINYDVILPEDIVTYPDGWEKQSPEGEEAENYVQSIFYRYRDITNKTVYSDWSENKTSSEEIVESDLIKIISDNVCYSYYHYCNNYYDGSYNVDSIQYGTGGVYHTKYVTSQMSASNIGDMGGKTLYGGEIEYTCPNGFRVWAKGEPERVKVYTYKTRSKTEKTEYSSWSSWSEEVPEEIENREIEEIVLYKEIVNEEETYPEGWVKVIPEGEVEENFDSQVFYRYHTTQQVTEYGDWGENQTSAEIVEESDTVELVSADTYYNYYHYCNNYYGGSYNVDSIQYGTGGVYHTLKLKEQMTASNIGDMGGKTLYGGEVEYACPNGFRVWAQSDIFEATEYVYRTRTKTEKTVFTPWSNWSATIPNLSEDYEIESVTLYKKKTADECPKGWLKVIPEGDLSENYVSKTFYRYSTVTHTTEYSDWSENQITTDEVTESDVLELVSDDTYYNYYHYCNNYYGGSYNVDSIQYGTGGVYHTLKLKEQMTASNIGDMGGKTLYGGESKYACSNGFRVWAQSSPFVTCEYTYRTRTKTEAEVYSPWSVWLENKPDEAENRVIEEATFYTKWDKESIAAGTSLILDGSVGVRVYFDLIEEVAKNTAFTGSVVNTQTNEVVFEVNDTPIYDSEKDLYYVTISIAPKDADKVKITSSVKYENIDVPVADLSVSNYISTFRELAEGNGEYAKAVGLVETLETYCSYADAYFNNTEIEDITLTDAEESAISEIAHPSITDKTLGDIEFCSTSLLLEGTVTLRHYFKVTGDVTLSDYTVEGGSELKLSENSEGYAYIDIENISANEFGVQKTVKITNNGETMEIAFSPLNYVKLAYNDDDTALKNLVRALYRYGVKATEYAK